MFRLCGSTFLLAKIGLVRAGCPKELSDTHHNRLSGSPIIITRNRERLGYVQATEYFPSGIIVAGQRSRNQLLEAGVTRSWAFVEAGVEIVADDAIGASELMSKLDSLLLEKFYGAVKQPVSGQPWPYIIEVYPFENYFIYSMKGQKYKQAFALDPNDRKVGLRGGSVAVIEKFVNADNKDAMQRVQTGVRYAWAPVKGNNQSFTTGGKNSELVTQVIRNWANILEAVMMYLNYTRNAGVGLKPPMQPSFYPVPLSPANKIVAALLARGIDIFSFAQWSATAFAEAAKGTKAIGNGDHVPHSKFAYVGDVKDPSTWHLPIHDAAHVQVALSRVNQTKGIPDAAKPGVLAKLRKMAKTKGIGVSDKPTTGQKKWVKSNIYPPPASGVHSGPLGGRPYPQVR